MSNLTYREGPEMARIIRKLRESCVGEDAHSVFMACLALGFIILDPEIEQDPLQEGVLKASEWMNMFVNGIDEVDSEESETDLPPNKVN